MLLKSFPILAVSVSVLAYFLPGIFIDFKPLIIPLLGVIMFSMGISLLPADFLRVLKQPYAVLLGICLQFGVMPLAAWSIATLMNFPDEYLLGMILVGACSGGTASNVICFLAKGDVALSISLTSLSTLLAIFATPFLTLLYAGQTIDVPALSMLFTILKVIVLPVTAGLLINLFLGAYLKQIKDYLPAISVLAIVFIIAIIVALNKGNIEKLTALLVLAVACHNAIGLMSGYWISRIAGQSEKVARTLAIEVGMQNSGLAVVLATTHFSVLAALPGALFSIWHNITGSLLAGYWGRKNGPSRNGQINDENECVAEQQ